VISVFIMDPLAGVNTYTDTTYVLMREAARRGHTVYHALLQDLYVRGSEVHVHGRAIRFTEDPLRWYETAGEEDLRVDDVDIVWQRKDPPFDFLYLNSTQLLETVSPRVFIFNHPRGLREANEKLYGLHFPDCGPETLVSARRDDILPFLDQVGGKAVIKRLDRSGGVGVYLLDKQDKNRNALIETVTEEGRTYAVVQRYLPGVVDGDKRIIVLDGEPIGAVLRRPRADDLRGNIHSGATTHACEITPAEREMCARIAPRLRADGLWFVGLDVIGERITEINVTSPTGFQEITRLTGEKLETKFLDFAETRARHLRAAAQA
jgi:glutathione synthase